MDASNDRPPSSSLGSLSKPSSPTKRSRQEGGAREDTLEEVIASAVDDRLSSLSAKLDAILTLEKKKKAPGKYSKPGIVSALRAHYGGLASAPTESKESEEIQINDDDDPEDQAVAPASDTTATSYAPTVIVNASSAGSVLNWVSSQTFNKSRNRFEALALAAAIDALLEDGVQDQSLGMEILCRRLTGVHLADESANWDLCKAVEWPYASQHLLDQKLLARAVKDAAAIGRLRDRVAKKTSKPSSYNRRGLYQLPDKSSNKFPNKSNPGVGPKTAGAAQR